MIRISALQVWCCLNSNVWPFSHYLSIFYETLSQVENQQKWKVFEKTEMCVQLSLYKLSPQGLLCPINVCTYIPTYIGVNYQSGEYGQTVSLLVCFHVTSSQNEQLESQNKCLTIKAPLAPCYWLTLLAQGSKMALLCQLIHVVPAKGSTPRKKLLAI